MKLSLLTRKNLTQIGILDEVIDFLEKNKLLPLPLHILEDSTGDYKSILKILRDNILSATIEVDDNNNVIQYDGKFTSFTASYNDNNQVLVWETKNSFYQYDYEYGVIKTSTHMLSDALTITTYENGKPKKINESGNRITDLFYNEDGNVLYKLIYTLDNSFRELRHYTYNKDRTEVNVYDIPKKSFICDIKKSLSEPTSHKIYKNIRSFFINKNEDSELSVDSVIHGGKLSNNELSYFKNKDDLKLSYLDSNKAVIIHRNTDNYITYVSVNESDIITRKYFKYDRNDNIIYKETKTYNKNENESVETNEKIEITHEYYPDGQLKRLGSLKIRHIDE